MRRSTVRMLAFSVLALLGAPLAVHVVMHDLHHDERQHHDVYTIDDVHGDHEHPIVSASAPQLRTAIRIVSIAVPVVAIGSTWTQAAAMRRNVIAHGAVRLDDDVGVQPLLSTFLI